MIYLDYSATTPVLEEVLDTYIKTTRDFIGNPNSIHYEGNRSRELLIKAKTQISNIFNVKNNEIIFTSGSSESNSSAILGVARKYKNRGKHIISTYLEHKSVLDTLDYLSLEGYEISYVKLQENGQIDLKDLESLIRKDTILLTVCAVNSEVGYKAPLKTIRQIVNKKNKLTIIHSDMTQALGKTNFNLNDVDLASFSGHKIYAEKGIGILYKKEDINITPLIFGTTSNTPFRGGTPSLPLIVSLSKAVRMITENLEEDIKYVEKLKNMIIKSMEKYDVIINSNSLCVPHIVNLSLMNIKSETFVRAIERYNIYISTNTACSSLEESSAIKAISDDKRRSTSTIRISLSKYTTVEEIKEFIRVFDLVYNSFIRS
ncbi:MAG: cysteine desulfurase family protein [Bacilli bacterium]